MELVHLTRAALAGWWNDRCMRMGAALSFYTTFSLAPVLLIAIMVAGIGFGQDAARGAIIGEIEGVIGVEQASAIETMLSNAGDFGSGFVSTAVGVAIFLVLATGAISELQDDLHQIWGVETEATPLAQLIRSRLLSLGFVVSIGFLLLVSLALDAGLSSVTDRVGSRMTGLAWAISAANFTLSLAAATALFALVFKVLPEFYISWRDALVGAFVSALLFQLGKFLIGFYIGRTGITTTYGAAASLVTILLWVYYSSQILFFGAEFTKAYSERYSKPGEGRAAGRE